MADFGRFCMFTLLSIAYFLGRFSGGKWGIFGGKNGGVFRVVLAGVCGMKKYSSILAMNGKKQPEN